MKREWLVLGLILGKVYGFSEIFFSVFMDTMTEYNLKCATVITDNIDRSEMAGIAKIKKIKVDFRTESDIILRLVEGTKHKIKEF